LILTHEIAAVHVAIAGAVLQRDPPLPARRPRVGLRIGRHRRGGSAPDREGAIAGQPLPPVLEAALQCTLDKEATEPRTVDEEIAFDARAALEHHRLDEAVLAAQPYVHDFSLGSLHSSSLGVRAQHADKQCGIELEGVLDAGHRAGAHLLDPSHPAGQRSGRIERIRREILGAGFSPAPQPVLLERQRAESQADVTERVEIAVSRSYPVVVLNGELEGAAGGPKHRILIDAEEVIDVADLRNGGLADADRADGIGFHDTDIQSLAHRAAEDGRGHPSGRAAADDDNSPDTQVSHLRTVSHANPCAGRKQVIERPRPDHKNEPRRLAPAGPRGIICVAGYRNWYENPMV